LSRRGLNLALVLGSVLAAAGANAQTTVYNEDELRTALAGLKVATIAATTTITIANDIDISTNEERVVTYDSCSVSPCVVITGDPANSEMSRRRLRWTGGELTQELPGLTIRASKVTVEGLVIQGFRGGILVDGAPAGAAGLSDVTIDKNTIGIRKTSIREIPLSLGITTGGSKSWM